MKFILLLFALLFVHSVYCEEKVDQPIEEEEEVTVAVKKQIFKKPQNIPENYFLLYFTSPSELMELLTVSEATKEGVEEGIAKYNGIWSVEVPQTSAIDEDYALVLKSKARHSAISAKLKKPFDFSSDQLVVQYEVKFQNGQECGGAYLKLLSQSDDLNLKQFNDKTQYTIMFGPDRCGNENKLHFIFQHKNPKTGKYEEKHAKKPSADIERHFTDKKTHLYTLVLNADNTFEVYIDQSLVNSGHLLKDFDPPVNAPKEIDDPTDIKPADWDDVAKIVDPSATKPSDWDDNAPEYIDDVHATKPDGWLESEPLTIADEKAERPKDWDDEMDGEWEAPRVDNPVCKSAAGCGPWTASKIKNPAYRGKWSAPLIDNPKYRGQWKPRKVENPEYFEDDTPYRSLAAVEAVGLELWSMSDEIVFDNLLIVDSKKAADEYSGDTWQLKKEAERVADPNSQSVVDAIREATSERPWLWLVMVLVVLIPVVLIVVYCCRTSSSSSSQQHHHRVMRDLHKKDDDIVEEEEEDEVAEEVQLEEESVAGGDTVSATAAAAGDVDDKHKPEESATSGSAVVEGGTTTCKGDLESDSEGDSGGSSADNNNSQSEEGAAVTGAQPSSSATTTTTISPGSTTRKRRARKE